MNCKKLLPFALLLVCLMASVSCLAQAAAAVPQSPVKIHRVVFAVTSGDEADWNMALGNIRNLMTGLAPAEVQVEVVAYSQGLNLVKKGSTLESEIHALQAKQVRFVACQNSMRMQHVTEADLLTGVTPVPSGIVEVVTKQEQGWAYIKAGR